MEITVVWIDFKEAKVFHLSHEKMSRERLLARHQEHHTHALDSNETEDPSLYDRVGFLLRGAKKILILGPGVARTHLLHQLEERFPEEARAVVGCEASDHPTDPQIAAYALKYLRGPTG